MRNTSKKDSGRYKVFSVFIIATVALFSINGQTIMGMGIGPCTNCPAPVISPNLINVTYLSSIPVANGNPGRTAMDKAGILYVANPTSGEVLKFYQDGSSAGSINGFKRPLSVAVDDSGRVYVGDLKDGSVTVVGTVGQILFTLGNGQGEFGMPGGIAIANGSIYITDSRNNIVKVYASLDGTYQFSFGGYGKGNGQMIFPTGITYDNINQEIYVVDHNNARIEVFDHAGTYKRSFGSYGAGSQKFTRPQGIFVKDGMVYVADTFQSTVQVLNGSDGSFVAYIGQNGTDPGNLKIPSDVIVRGQKVFISNTDNERIEVFQVQDPNALVVNPSTLSFSAEAGASPVGQSVTIDSQVSGTAVQWAATVSTSTPFSVTLSASAGTTSTSVTINVDTTGLAAGSYTGTVNFRSAANGVDYPLTINLSIQPPLSQLVVSPASINFDYQRGSALPNQVLSTSGSGGSSNLSWTASTNVSWIDLSPNSGQTPSTITVSLNQNADSLSAGAYTGTVSFASNGINYPIPVNLTVARPQLSVSPTSIDLFHQTNGELANREVSITSSGGNNVSWTATTDVSWLTLSMYSGQTPSKINVSLNQSADTLPEGSQTATVTINAPDATGSPATIAIMLRVVQAGTIMVNTNLDRAFFTITGPAAYSGSGKTWKTDEAKPGTYTIQFGYVQGFRRPTTRTFEVKTGSSVTLDVQYQSVSVANVIAAAKGPGRKNDGLVKLLDLTGNTIIQFMALDTMYGAKVAMGDVDGDGNDEIVVAPGPGQKNQALIKVYRTDGTFLTSTDPVSGTINGAAVATGDIFGSGKSEIAVSMINTSTETEDIVVYALDNNQKLAEKGRLSFSLPVSDNDNEHLFPLNLAFGDTNGDGKLELITVEGNDIDIYSFDNNYTPSLIATTTVQMNTDKEDYKSQMAVSAGDANGDGMDEVILGLNNHGDSFVYILKSDLTAYGLSFTAFANGESVPTLSCADIDGDGVSEILAGAGNDSDNKAVLRIYHPDNVNQPSEITVFSDTYYGVNAALGYSKR